MVFSYERKSNYMNSVPYCEIGPSWIILFDGEKCPLSDIKFTSETEVRNIVKWLNKVANKRRFKLNVRSHGGLSECFQIWDNYENKAVRFAPLHMGASEPTVRYQEYVDFLNDLYEETPINK